MAYENGIPSSPNDLLDKLRIFAVAQGWTQNRWTTAGSGYELALSKGSAYFNFRSFTNETAFINGSNNSNKYGIAINGSDGYSGGAAWDRQSGYPIRPSGTAGSDQRTCYLPMVTNFGPFPNYYFFAPDSKTIYLELEITVGVFLRLGFGTLDLFNGSTPGGGRFFYATGGSGAVTSSVGGSTWLGSNIDDGSYSLEEVPFRGADYNIINELVGSFVRCAFDSFDGWASSERTPSTFNSNMSCQGGGVHDKILRELSNPLNQIGIICPNVVSANRGNQYLHPIGTVPGMRYMNMTSYLPGEEFTIGSDTWKVFPWYEKGGRSYQRGIAYLKIV